MTRRERYLFAGIPILFCLLVYWYGLKSWFAQDDFAWLSLPLTVHNFHDFLDAAFAPKAQGTIRPWSERLFFLAFNYLFGFDARPFRLWVFFNQFLNLVLLSALMWRITGSRAATLAAPILWLANTSLTVPMAWSSAYNEIQCSGFLLGSLYLFVRYTQTGERRYYIWQWVVFLLGFGSLELNVVYPALALTWAVCCAPRYWRSTLPLFAASALYTVIHRSFAPKEVSFYYRMYFDSGLFSTLAKYWAWTLGFTRLENHFTFSHRLAVGLTLAVTLALGAFVIQRLLKRDWLVLLGPAWYLIVLAPVLPLKNHITDYYLTMPSIGIAILGAYAIGVAWTRHLAMRAVAAVLAGAYLWAGVTIDRLIMRYQYDRSKRVEMLVESVAYAHNLHPKSAILLNGVDDELFWAAIWDNSFRALQIPNVYLTPDSRAGITADTHQGSMDDHFLAPALINTGLRQRQVQVYQVTQENLQNITSTFARTAAVRYPTTLLQRIDLANTLYQSQIGEGWHQGDVGFRWMSKSASVTLAGPTSSAQKLYLKGLCAPQSVADKPLRVAISVSGHPLPDMVLTSSKTTFDTSLQLPPEVIGQREVKVTVTVDHTIQVAGDPRQLGLAFGVIAIE